MRNTVDRNWEIQSTSLDFQPALVGGWAVWGNYRAMNVIYGVPVVPKTLKLSLDQPEQSNETFSQMICENVLKVSKT